MAHDTNDGALPLVILAFADAQGTSKKKEALRLHEEQRAIEAALERGDLLEAYPM